MHFLCLTGSPKNRYADFMSMAFDLRVACNKRQLGAQRAAVARQED